MCYLLVSAKKDHIKDLVSNKTLMVVELSKHTKVYFARKCSLWKISVNWVPKVNKSFIYALFCKMYLSKLNRHLKYGYLLMEVKKKKKKAGAPCFFFLKQSLDPFPFHSIS